jgi:hypothetical protein
VTVPKINPPPPPGEDPRDSELLERLAQARACGDDGECRALSGELIAGWLPQVERYARFRGLSRDQVDDAVGRWGERIVKALRQLPGRPRHRLERQADRRRHDRRPAH